MTEDSNNWKTLMIKKRKALGQRIREARKKRKWTILDLAKKVGLSENGMRLIETGERWPRGHNLEEIARQLNVSITSLFEGTDEPSTKSPLKEATEISLKEFEKLIDKAFEKVSGKNSANGVAAALAKAFEQLSEDDKIEVTKFVKLIAEKKLPLDAIPKEAQEIEVFQILKAQKNPKLFEIFLLNLTANISLFYRYLGLKAPSNHPELSKSNTDVAPSKHQGTSRRTRLKVP